MLKWAGASAVFGRHREGLATFRRGLLIRGSLVRTQLGEPILEGLHRQRPTDCESVGPWSEPTAGSNACRGARPNCPTSRLLPARLLRNVLHATRRLAANPQSASSCSALQATVRPVSPCVCRRARRHVRAGGAQRRTRSQDKHVRRRSLRPQLSIPNALAGRTFCHDSHTLPFAVDRIASSTHPLPLRLRMEVEIPSWTSFP